jgi:uracil-DNA glycosylase family 4
MQLGKTFVKPTLNLDAPYVLIGEQPGHKEVRYGKPFVGPAGRCLDECLHKVGIPRSDCYLSNVVTDLDNNY